MHIESNPSPLLQLFRSLCGPTRLWQTLCVAVLQLFLLVPSTVGAAENTSPSFNLRDGMVTTTVGSSGDDLGNSITPSTPTKHVKSTWWGTFRVEEEYNDERSFANLFGNKIMGYLGSSSDVDWYGFALPTGRDIKVTFEGKNYQPGTWNLSWYSPTMQGLSELNIATSTRDGIPTYTYTFNTGNSAGTYYLRVRAYSPTTFKSDAYFVTVDAPKPTISLVQSEISIVEGNTTDPVVPVAIQLDFPSTGAIVVHYTVRSGTANVGTTYNSDVYGASAGNVTINPGSTTATIGDTHIWSDTHPESNEYFWVDFDSIVVGSAQFALGASSLSAKVNIIDDDSAATISVSLNGTGSGTVTSTPAGINCGSFCSAFFTSGTSVTLSATADSGSAFSGWSGACSGAGACTVTMNQAQSVTATFDTGLVINSPTPKYTLSVTKSGTGSGTVAHWAFICGTNCSYAFTSGTSVTLTATATTGSTFAGWDGACASSGTSATCTVSMNQAQSVTATFMLVPVSSASLYDGIYLWDDNHYLSVHQIGGGTLIGTIYWNYTANSVQIGARTISTVDTFDLFHGQIVGSNATMSGPAFYRACTLSYDLTFNSDSSLTVRLNSVNNSPGVNTADVNCAAQYNPVGSVWTIPRIF